MLGLLLAAGFASGILAGLLGVGGGIVMVPVLYHLLPQLGAQDQVLMHMAVGTSLATIIPTSIRSSLSHHKRQAVDWHQVKLWAPAIFLGALAGALIAKYLRGEVLTGLFGTLALIMAANLFFGRDDWRLQNPWQGLKGKVAPALAGFFSSLIGIGGGTFSVPLLVAYGHNMRQAVGTSSAFGLAIALPGAFGFVITGWDVGGRTGHALGYVDPLALVLLSFSSTLAAPLGAKIAHGIPPKNLRRFFAVFLVLMGCRMWFRLLA